MSGRIVDSDYVKDGELLPVAYINLTESNNPSETSAEIQAVYLDARKMRDDIRISDEERVAASPMTSGADESFLKGETMSRLEFYNYLEESKGWLPRNEWVDMLREYGLPDLPTSSDAFKRKLMNMPGKEKALREELERKAVEYGVRMRGSSKREMKRELMERKTHKYPAKDADALRKEVLSVSLFPNLYNKKSLLRGM